MFREFKLTKRKKLRNIKEFNFFHLIGYPSKQIAEDAQVIISLKTVKSLKANIRENESITRESGTRRPQKLLEAHKSHMLKLITDSPYNTWNRIEVKQWDKHGVKVGKVSPFRFLIIIGINQKYLKSY